MRKRILYLGLILILINTFAILVMNNYKALNMLMVDFSLIISIFLLLFSTKSWVYSRHPNITLLFFTATGLVRVVCSLIIAGLLDDISVIVTYLFILFFETLAIVFWFNH